MKPCPVMLLLLALFSPGVWADTPSESPREGFWAPDGPVEAVAVADGVLYLGGSFTHLGLDTGPFVVLDENTSMPRVPAARANGRVFAVEPDGFGGWIIGGSFDSVGGEPHRYVARILADGSISDWDPFVGFEVECILVDGSTVYLAGSFIEVNGVERRRAAAVDLDTGALLPWNPGANGTVFTLAKLGDTVYLGGQFTEVGGETRSAIAAVDEETGALLPWNPNATPASVWDIEPTSDAIYVGGNFDSIGGENRNRLAALHPESGSALPFDPNPDSTVLALAADGASLFAGGLFTEIGGVPRSRIAEIEVATGLATAWNPEASGGDSPSIERIIVENQQVYVCGAFTSIGGAARKHVAVLDPSTGLAAPFSTDFEGTDSTAVHDMAVTESEIAVGGRFETVAAQPRDHLAAIDLETGSLLQWDPGADSSVRKLFISGTTLYVGGSFTRIGETNRRFVAAFDVATGELTDFDARITTHTGYVAALERAGSTLLLGGDFQNFEGGVRINLAAVDADIGSLNPWDMDASHPVLALHVDEASGTLFAGGLFTRVTENSVSRDYLAAFDAGTGELRPFAPGMSRAVRSLETSGGTLYVGGDFESIDGSPRGHLAAFDIATGALTDWDPTLAGGNSSRTALGIDVHRSQVFVAGEFEFVNGQHRPFVAAIDPVSGATAAWQPAPNRAAWSIDAAGDVLAVGGEFLEVGAEPRPYLAVLDFQALTADPLSFEVVVGTLIDGDVTDLHESDDSNIHTRSGFGQSFIDLHHMEMVVHAVTAANAPTTLDISIESRIDQPAGSAQLRLRNWNTNEFELVGQYAIENSETTELVEDIDAAPYVSGTGQIDLSIKHIVFVPFLAFTFDSYIDHVQMTVE